MKKCQDQVVGAFICGMWCATGIVIVLAGWDESVLVLTGTLVSVIAGAGFVAIGRKAK